MSSRKRRQRPVAKTLSVSLCLALGQPAMAASDLFDLSIEELVNLEVTSVSRKPESLSDATSAVYVITKADIARHGVRSIPDALRLAPGLSVQQIDANKWSVASRGFAGRYTNKLLVLMDGRQLYTPSFSGVYWDVQHTLIEQVERIEVIRGPGAVVWGTNAVNGVINIITSGADADGGSEVIAGLDPEGAATAGVRLQGGSQDGMAYRAFAHYTDHDGYTLRAGGDANDNWDLLKLNFRGDWATESGGKFAVTVEGHQGTMGVSRRVVTFTPPFQLTQPDEAEVDGAFALLQWSAAGTDTRSTSAQFYVDVSERSDQLYAEERTTVSIEMQHQRKLGKHDLSIGGSLRHNDYSFVSSERIAFFGDIGNDMVASAYIQDEIELVEDRFSVVAGLKLESNDLSPEDIEWMPTLRALWKPSENHAVWAAVTRAVRAPSITDKNIRVLDLGAPIPPLSPLNPFPLPARQGSVGNPDFESETSVSYEVGVRGSWTETLSYDLALFSVEYDNFRALTVLPDPVCYPSEVALSADPSCLFTSTYLLGLAQFTNDDSAHSHGAELSVDWQVSQNLRLRSSVSVANDQQETTNPFSVPQSSSYPSVQANLRAEWSINDVLSTSVWLRYVDELDAPNIDDVWQGNVHLLWSPNQSWSVSTGVRNLIEDNNYEFRSDINDVERTTIERTAFVNIRYSF